MFAQFTAHLSYTYALTQEKDWYFRTDADIFSQNNFDSAAEYYNVFAVSAKLGLGYRGDKFDIYVPLKYGRMHYLERDFLETIGVEPRMNITLSKSLIGNLNARYTERSYLDVADKNRDDTVMGYGGGFYWLFDKNFAYLTSNYDNYEAENANSLLFTDKETFNLTAGVNYNVNDLFITRLGYRYRYTLYGDFLPNGNKQRSDYYNQGEVKVSKMFLDTMEGSLLYRYSTNRSNYNLAEYDKDVVLFGLQYNY
jgi:opacity protein-like surface antigen